MSDEPREKAIHFVSDTCNGEKCFCGLTRNGNDWTYCEDALPSDVKSGYYFATRKTNSGRTYTWQTHFSQELQSWSVISDETVIAWQPLPAPAEPKEEK